MVQHCYIMLKYKKQQIGIIVEIMDNKIPTELLVYCVRWAKQILFIYKLDTGTRNLVNNQQSL